MQHRTRRNLNYHIYHITIWRNGGGEDLGRPLFRNQNASKLAIPHPRIISHISSRLGQGGPGPSVVAQVSCRGGIFIFRRGDRYRFSTSRRLMLSCPPAWPPHSRTPPHNPIRTTSAATARRVSWFPPERRRGRARIQGLGPRDRTRHRTHHLGRTATLVQAGGLHLPRDAAQLLAKPGSKARRRRG